MNSFQGTFLHVTIDSPPGMFQIANVLSLGYKNLGKDPTGSLHLKSKGPAVCLKLPIKLNIHYLHQWLNKKRLLGCSSMNKNVPTSLILNFWYKCLLILLL